MVESAAAPTADKLFALLNPFSEATPDPATASAHPASAWANPAVTLARITPEERLALLGDKGPLREQYHRYRCIRAILKGEKVPSFERRQVEVEREVRLRLSELRHAEFRAGLVATVGEAGTRFLGCFDATLERGATRHQPRKLEGAATRELRRDFHRAQQLVASTQLWPDTGDAARLWHLDTLATYLDPRLNPGYADPREAKGRLRLYVKEERQRWEQEGQTGEPPTYERVRRDILRKAIALVLSRRGEEQRHRFGTTYARDESGDLDAYVPWSPDPAPGERGGAWLDYWDWFADEVDKAFVAVLLDQPYPRRAGDDGRQYADVAALTGKDTPLSLDHQRLLSFALEHDPALVLIEREAAREQLALLRPHLARREREVFDFLLGDPEATNAEVADALDTTPDNVRQIRFRIKQVALAHWGELAHLIL